jgi:hypothetical protein
VVVVVVTVTPFFVVFLVVVFFVAILMLFQIFVVKLVRFADLAKQITSFHQFVYTPS